MGLRDCLGRFWREKCGASEARSNARVHGAFDTIESTWAPTILNIGALVMAIHGAFHEDESEKDWYRGLEFSIQIVSLFVSWWLASTKSLELEKQLDKELNPSRISTRCFWNTSPTSLGNAAGVLVSSLGIFNAFEKGKATNNVLRLVGPFVSQLATTCNTASLESEVNYSRIP